MEFHISLCKINGDDPRCKIVLHSLVEKDPLLGVHISLSLLDDSEMDETIMDRDSKSSTSLFDKFRFHKSKEESALKFHFDRKSFTDE